MEERIIKVDIGGIEVAELSFDGKEIIVQEGDEQSRFTEYMECIVHIAESYFIPNFFDEIKPDRLYIEILYDGERKEFSTHEIYHDEFAAYCHKNRKDQAKIERKLKKLYQYGNTFCRAYLTRYIRLMKGADN
jgi:hypothetical protein